LKTNLDNLKRGINRLKEKSETLQKNSNKILSERSILKTAINKSDECLDILEIPNLGDICVRTGLYSESLDLYDFTKEIEKKLEIIVIFHLLKKVIKNHHKTK
jgi:hypothetical protein